MSTIPSLESYPMAIDPRPLSERLTPGERVAEALRLHAEDSDAEDVSKAESQPVDDGYLGMKPLTGIYHGFRDNHNIRSVATNDFKRMVLAQSAALASMSSSASTSSVAAPAAASSSSSSSSLSSSSSSSLSAPAAAAPVAAAAPAANDEPESEDEDDGEEKFRSPFKFKLLLRLIQESEIAAGISIADKARENITHHMAAAAIDYMSSGRVFMEAGKGVKTLTEEHLAHGDNAFFRLLPEYKQDGKTVVSIETGKAIADRFVIYENDHGRDSIDIKQHDLDNASMLTEVMIAGLDKRVAGRRETVRRVKAARKEKRAAASKKRKERKADKKEGQPALKKSKPASKSA